MTCWPVIVRELRAESRRASNYWLRVFGTEVAILVSSLMVTNFHIRQTEVGELLFTSLNALMFSAIWVVAPLIIADCLSRERREGTLGLLFLTPLKPFGIVLGKSLIHGWRAGTLFLASVPVLTLPLLFGGVSGKDVALAILLDSSALLWALAAGLLASAWGREWRRVMIAAEVLGLAFALAFMVCQYLAFLVLDAKYGAGTVRLAAGAVRQSPVALAAELWRREPLTVIAPMLFMLNTGFNAGSHWTLNGISGWRGIWGGQPLGFQSAWLASAAGLLVLSLGLLCLVMGLAAWRVARAWREIPAAASRRWLWQTFCTPRFWRSVFRGKMTRLLDRNPIGWLQQHSWSARLTRWTLCLLLVLVECALLGKEYSPSLWTGQSWLAQLLLFIMAFAATGSLHQEKENGMLELLLVAPLKVGQIISGRLCGIWRQFLPAALILSFAWLRLIRDAQWLVNTPYFFSWPTPPNAAWSQVQLLLFFVAAYLTLPIIGLYLSLSAGPIFVAWLWTVLIGEVAGWMLLRDSAGLTFLCHSLPALSIEVLIGLLFYSLLYRGLSRRRFVVRGVR